MEFFFITYSNVFIDCSDFCTEIVLPWKYQLTGFREDNLVETLTEPKTIPQLYLNWYPLYLSIYSFNAETYEECTKGPYIIIKPLLSV